MTDLDSNNSPLLLFETLVTQIFVGLAVGSLLALAFAPTFFFNWTAVDFALTHETWVMTDSGSVIKPKAYLHLNNMEFIQVTISGNSCIDTNLVFCDTLENDNAIICAKTGSPPNDALNRIMFILLAFWLIKYMHEEQVIAYFRKAGIKKGIELLRAMAYIFLKVLFLSLIYYLILEVFMAQNYKLAGWETVMVGGIALSGYIIPDILHKGWMKKYYKKDKHKIVSEFRRLLDRWVYLDLTTVIIIALSVILSRSFVGTTPEKFAQLTIITTLALNLIGDYVINARTFFKVKPIKIIGS